MQSVKSIVFAIIIPIFNNKYRSITVQNELRKEEINAQKVNRLNRLKTILADAINGKTKEFDTFAQIPWIPFPGGRALRVPYSVMGSWWYALKDTTGM